MLDREKVARAIAEQRKIKGMTQKQLADILNVSYQAVSRWEQGLSLPSVDMIYDIAQALETTVDFLLNGLSEERKVISYIDTGLDTKKLYMVKERINSLITRDDQLLYAKYTDPVFFRLDTSAMEEPVWVSANHVPGSKERFAMENGYDREICIDLVSSAANNLIRFGVKPAIIQANIVCGNNDSGQLILMGEAFKEACESSGIVFAGMEVGGQAVNYHAGEYRIGASVIGVADRKEIITGDRIMEGDILIGLCTEGISSTSYPFVKVILDRRPDIVYVKIDGQNLFMDEMMKPNACYVNVVNELKKQNLIHGIFVINNSLFNRKCYCTMPKGLGAGISVSQIQVSALYRYIYNLNMMDRECFLRDFSLGIGMVLAVSEKQYDRAVRVIEKYHQCYRLGTIQKDNEHPDLRVWLV
ncbi:MAG: helix-turn-helix domain-containing protein [Lachnospiraceae bacterium]|nr:helix-turn-helix domain-containing protein [Lachnospiraceae bacterium]